MGLHALSRARAESHLYLAAEGAERRRERDDLGGRHVAEAEDALGRLARDLAREGRQEAATARGLEPNWPGTDRALGRER